MNKADRQRIAHIKTKNVINDIPVLQAFCENTLRNETETE